MESSKQNNNTSVMLQFQTKSIVNRIASNFGWSVVSEATGKGIFVITNIYLARKLGVENYGLFTFSQTVVFYFWLAVDLGTNMYSIKEIAIDKNNALKIINPLFTLRITAGFFVFILYITSIVFMDLCSLTTLTFICCGFYLLTFAFNTEWVMKGFEKFNYITISSISSAILFLLFALIFIRQKEDVIIGSLAWSVSYALSSIILIYLSIKKLKLTYVPCYDLKIWFFHLKKSIYFTISGSMVSLYQYVPIFFLGLFFSSEQIGIFSAPYRIVITIAGGGFLIPMAFYPVFAELFATDKVSFHRTHKVLTIIMAAIAFPIVFLGTFYSEFLINILFSAKYEESIPVLKLIIWLIPLYFFRFTYGSVLLATGFQRYHNIGTSLGAISAFIVGLFLIPRYSYYGASYTLLIAEFIMAATMCIVYHFLLNSNRILLWEKKSL